MMQDVPKDWRIEKVGSFMAEVKERVIPTELNSTDYIGLEHIQSHGRLIGKGDSSEVKSTKTAFKANDVLYGKLRPYLNKHVVVDFDGVCSTDILVYRNTNIAAAKYFNYWLDLDTSIKQLSAEAKGINLPRVSASILNSFDIPVPPENQLKSIVTKLDTLFAHLNRLKARLEKIPDLLKQFRQTVLMQAVTGKLTEEWRQNNDCNVVITLKKIIDNRQKILKSNELKDVDPVEWEKFEIPNSWQWIKLWDISFLVTSGSRDWSKYYSDHGAYFVRSAEINDNKLRLNEAIFVELPTKVEGKRSLIEKGDLLVTITGANVGKCAKVETRIPEAYVSQSVALIKLIDKETTDYVHMSLLAPLAGGDQLLDMAYGMGRPVLSLPQIKSVWIPFPPLEEQKEIVRRVESLFAVADRIEGCYKTLHEKIDQLPQSILSKAFRGELFKQH